MSNMSIVYAACADIRSSRFFPLVDAFSFKLPQTRLARLPIAVVFAFAVAAFISVAKEREKGDTCTKCLSRAIGGFEKLR